MVACALAFLIGYTAGRGAIPETFQRGQIVGIDKEYAADETLNCLARQKCEGQAVALITTKGITITCDEARWEVEEEEVSECAEDHDGRALQSFFNVKVGSWRGVGLGGASWAGYLENPSTQVGDVSNVQIRSGPCTRQEDSRL
jgi:hypothetical protein